MSKSVNEWIANESKEDFLVSGMSLKQENYRLPMIKLTFGDQVLPLPQSQKVYQMAGFGHDNLKHSVVNACYHELKDIEGLDLRFTPLDTEEDWSKAYEAMGKVIQEIGPYKVCENAFMRNWCVELDGLVINKEQPANYEIGEPQEWERKKT